MVGKKELLGWVSATCGRPVASFSALKDGDALVRCVEETWPLAYDEVQPRFPKRMDGSRDSKENFELVKAVFASIGLPPEALDVRGVRASAFKPCYNLLVVCFFLRNLALHGDFSVDFTHQIDATLTQFLQSPASVESLRRGGALPPGPGEKTPGKKPRKKAESAPRRPRRRASGAPDAASALSLLGSALETATAASPYGGIENGGIEPSEPNAALPTRGPDAKPTRRGLAYRRGERATRRVPSASSSDPVFRPPSPPRGASANGGGGFALVGVFLRPRRVVALEGHQKLGFAPLETLHAKLETIRVALAEAVVVELSHEGRKVAVLERVGKLLSLHEVGVPHRERASVGGPRDDVVARLV